MDFYHTKTMPAHGTSWSEVSTHVMRNVRDLKRKTKRRPYIRSCFFDKQKVFIELFWQHLYEKENISDKTRRLKYLPCAIELIRHSYIQPETKENPNRKSELLHRFYGKTPKGDVFCVQIKEERRTGKKWLLSVFPYK